MMRCFGCSRPGSSWPLAYLDVAHAPYLVELAAQVGGGQEAVANLELYIRARQSAKVRVFSLLQRGQGGTRQVDACGPDVDANDLAARANLRTAALICQHSAFVVSYHITAQSRM